MNETATEINSSPCSLNSFLSDCFIYVKVNILIKVVFNIHTFISFTVNLSYDFVSNYFFELYGFLRRIDDNAG
jgi:hypothetical protein